MDNKVIEKDDKKSKTEDESSSDDSFNLDLELKCETCNKTFSSLKGLVQHEKSGKHYKKLSQKKLDKKVNENLEDNLSDELNNLMLYGKSSYAACDACVKEFSGPESFHQHLKSKAHHKKVAKAKLLEQVTENGKIDIEKFEQIYKQKNAHQEAATGASAYSPTLEETESYGNVIAKSHQFECINCDKVFTGVDSWFQHLVSKTHEKTIKQKKLLDQVTAGVSSIDPGDSAVASSPLKVLDAIEVDGDVLICRMCHKSFSGPESAASHLKSKGHARKKDIKEWKIQHSARESATVATQKTKAQDLRNKVQASVPAPITGFDYSLSSKEIINDLSAGKGTSNNRAENHSDIKEESSGSSKSPDGGSSEVAGETKNAVNENTLLCYESYKNYKKIMNKIEEENNYEKEQ